MKKDFLRRNMYKWHRISSIIILLPMFFWTLSGFLMPLMGYFKPSVKTHITQDSIQFSENSIELSEALKKNRIDTISNFRFVTINTQVYYQIEINKTKPLIYINTITGDILENADKMYAEILANKYLIHSHTKHTEKNRNIEFISSFNNEYSASNKMLPVYKINMNTENGLRLFVNTQNDKLATAIDNKRFYYLQFFAWAHSWNFLNSWGNFKYILIGLFSIIGAFSTIAGFYIYNISSAKKKVTASKKWHRTLGNIFTITTFLFCATAAWHTLSKINKTQYQIEYQPVIAAKDLTFNASSLKNIFGAFNNASVFVINNDVYWNLKFGMGMKIKSKIINAQTNEEIKDGELKYTKFLATKISNNNQEVIETKYHNKFGHEYKMMSKYLPIIEVKTKTAQFFIDPLSRTLAQTTIQSSKLESFAFGQLHMHHYPEMILKNSWGKSIRNTILFSTTLGLIIVVITGLYIFLRRKGFIC